MKTKRFKINAISLSIFLAYALTPYSEAALVRDDVDYQIFRDFAENKGKFFVGATDLSVKNKQGQNIGNALSNVPMIDFSVADVNRRTLTVIDPQYAVSVKHVKGDEISYYGHHNGHLDVSNDENEYRSVAQNDYEPNKNWHHGNQGRLEDYNMARLNKFVTEVAPIAPTSAGGGVETYKDKNRFSEFVRVGAGTQFEYNSRYNMTELSRAYRYAIAGTPYQDVNVTSNLNQEGLIGFGDNSKHHSPEKLKEVLSQNALTNYAVLGDSGSPLFAYDKQEKRWVFLGAYDYWAGYQKNSWQEWNIYKKEFADKIKQRDNAGTIKGYGEHHWKTTGTNSHIGSTAVRLANNERDANNGQNVTFENNGTLVLDQNINQGAGGLFFKGDYTVKGANNDITWLGAGIDVADGKKVVWQVKNPNGDRLAKIGKGTLEINGTGVNQGQLKVGDGTVILNQKADSNQKVQAFSQVGIVSGRGTLVLNSSNQINPDNLYFGFRGGRLDANGNDLTFEHIRNVDEGARIVNHNTDRASTITLTGKSLITAPQNLSVYEIRNDYDDDDYYGYYSYRKPIPQGKDLYYKNYRYYALKSGGSVNAPMPENGQTENNDWILMGSTQEEAKKNAMNHKNNQRISGFSGFFGEENGKGHNGALNLNFNGKSAQNRFLLTGGTNLNGKISVTQGNVLLSGRPTPHARDFVNKSSARKDAHFSKNNEVVFEDDWINRTFKAAEITVNQSASFSSGRNVSNITANITATDNAKVNLGYKNGDEVCVRSDYTGYVTCNTDNLSDKALNSFGATQINGNVNLSQNAALVLGKAALWGQIQGQGNSSVSLNQHSKWHLTGDSQVHNLSLADSHIHLNNASDAQSANKYHTLKINHLSGNGHFHYLTHLAKNLGDKVLVKESASGHYQLHVQDKTGEPNQEGLNLFDASSVRDRSRLSVSLANNHVDLGALRYTIKTENGITRLYNPYAENRRRVKPAPSPATNTASQAQKATQTDGAQIAKPQNIVVAPPSPQANQAEEAKRQQAKAEQVKRQQAEAERKSAELAKQKAEAEREASELATRQKAEQERSSAELARRHEKEREAAELSAKQKVEAEREAQALAVRRKAEAEEAKRQAAELARRHEKEREAAELSAKQRVGEEERRQTAQSQPQRRKRRAAPQDYMAASQDRPKRRGHRSVQQNNVEIAQAQAELARRQQEERKAAELLAKQRAEAEREAQALAARRKAEAEEAKRQAAELAHRQEAERKAAELSANQKAAAEAQALAARQQKALARQQEEARKAAELAVKQKAETERKTAELAKQRAAAEAAKRQQEARQTAELARRQEAERQAAELSAKQKAETDREAAESAKRKAEEEEHRQAAQSQPQRRKRRAAPQDYMAASQNRPKRRGRRSTLPAPPSPSFDSSAYAAPRALHNPDWYENDYEEIPLDALEDENVSESVDTSDKQPQDNTELHEKYENDYEEIPLDALEDEDVSESVDTSDKQPQDNTELHEKVETVSLQPRAAQPRAQAAAQPQAQADAVSTNTNSALSDAMASTQSILLDTGASLTRHIAQKSRADAEKNSVWMSNIGYGRDYASAQYRRFSSKRTQTQIGIDRSLSENMQIGGVLTYSDSQHTFDQASGKNTFVQANLYGKYYLNDAWYVAGDIGAGSLRSRLQTQQKANFNRTSIQTGLTLGNTLKINQFEIVPSAGIRYSRLSSADYKLGNDSVKVSSMSVKTLTAGLDFAYRFKVGNLTVKPLLSAAYFANYGKGGVNVGGNSFVYKADNQQQYSAGAALLYRNVTLNVNGSITKGKQLEKQKSGQIKIQIRF
ncbi:TPA: IgA-specific serine endopeptidase autotransporter [Neisseria meningitidis]|uniref:IgA-specific serine endopeptidase autotransporter n=1 Tax=Neisseria meningitidis TaxID=487 RepID=UPI000C344EBE|nr:IgA-specific serine endopeptidase autotransporter [Neisseria meningitidis]MBJ7811345.1 IgA-specific serine endopeptidase autotransporter [Neisseria meningitidis]MCL5693287.1 IgA-specific serine endopeptidase autotransporter [Neisseria meningitidis]MCL5698935.1 IgA-specific serine endopeptidase autotransporter [Neisseria meningitidis]MCL5717086.1 IgA-specific serine endopeptidase autotransporter [Neisseria meningitidis]MCL5836338.1 IgA-specific serine endopeptidase autotransporter [Neisseria